MAEAQAKKQWDMASTNGMASGARYVRDKSDALLVLAVRADDFAVAAHPDLRADDVDGLLSAVLPDVLALLRQQRAKQAMRNDRGAGKPAQKQGRGPDDAGRYDFGGGR